MGHGGISPATMGRLRLGSIVPNFAAETTDGPIRFHDWLGGTWAVLFSHPDDFTPVCTTELADLAKRDAEFRRRGVKLLGLSANDVSSHRRWIQDIADIACTTVQFPIIGDPTREIAELFDMLDALDPTNVDAAGLPFTIRDVLIIDPQKVLRLRMTYPASTGRNVDEILRVIDSLQLGDQYPVTTPANWRPGDKVIIHPRVLDKEASSQFPHYEAVKTYLRFAPDPRQHPAL